MKKQNVINIIKDYSLITLGVILVAFGIQYFYAPNEIAGGEITFGLDKGIDSLIAVIINGLLVDKVIAMIEKKKATNNDYKQVEKTA